MGDDTRKQNTTITTRYREDQMDVYQGVMDLVKEHTPNLSKSLAQFLLVQKGLAHMDNPGPLVKEVEKKVYVDRPVYLDKPKDEHITDNESGQANEKGQRASDDKLTNPNKAKSDLASSKPALEVEKSSKSSNVGSWIVGLSVLGVIIYGLIKS